MGSLAVLPESIFRRFEEGIAVQYVNRLPVRQEESRTLSIARIAMRSGGG